MKVKLTEIKSTAKQKSTRFFMDYKRRYYMKLLSGEMVKLGTINKTLRIEIKSRNWHLSSNGYVQTGVAIGKAVYNVKLHHVIIGKPTVENPSTDHINRDKLDNRTENLRHCTVAQNCNNKTRKAIKEEKIVSEYPMVKTSYISR